jgi:hypothetical protein
MTSSQRLRRVEVEDGWIDATGCVRPFYPKITVFYILDPRGTINLKQYNSIKNKCMMELLVTSPNLIFIF